VHDELVDCCELFSDSLGGEEGRDEGGEVVHGWEGGSKRWVLE